MNQNWISISFILKHSTPELNRQTIVSLKMNISPFVDFLSNTTMINTADKLNRGQAWSMNNCFRLTEDYMMSTWRTVWFHLLFVVQACITIQDIFRELLTIMCVITDPQI